MTRKAIIVDLTNGGAYSDNFKSHLNLVVVELVVYNGK